MENIYYICIISQSKKIILKMKFVKLSLANNQQLIESDFVSSKINLKKFKGQENITAIKCLVG